MECRKSHNHVRLLLVVIPFLVPWLMVLVGEMYGNVVAWNYAMAALLIVSLIALYIWGVASAIFCDKKADVAHKLCKLHFVEIPLFTLVWFVHFVVFLIVVFCVNGFDGIQ